MQLVFATHNPNKLIEIKALLPHHLEIMSLNDIGCTEEIPETAKTIEGNAIIKANHIKKHYHLSCFADDTGLEIESLNGEPGVYSARYAGEEKNAKANIQKVLTELKGIANRKARFKTVIALHLDNGEKVLFQGIVNGEITEAPRGTQGFGYDPIFKPEGYDKTFAELPLSVKNEISHRGKAIKQLIEYLNH